jgi:hypothetical protein
MPETNEVKGSEARVNINLRQHADPILDDLVRLVEKSTAEIPITLMVGGILVSGMLVSHKSYLNYFSTEFPKSCQDAEIVGFIQSQCKKAEEAPSSPKSEEGPPEPRQYIHLKDAKYFVPSQNPIPQAGGIWWRGHMSEVDGFNIGTLGITKE